MPEKEPRDRGKSDRPKGEVQLCQFVCAKLISIALNGSVFSRGLILPFCSKRQESSRPISNGSSSLCPSSRYYYKSTLIPYPKPSFPATAMRYGLEVLAPYFFDSAQPTSPSAWNAPSTHHTDIALSGPNIGANYGLKVFISGTVAAAVEAARLGYPAIAFSGTSGYPRPWDDKIDEDGRKSRYVGLYANWAANVTDTLTYAGFGEGQMGVYMPNGTWLNVNFPATDGDTDGDGDADDQGRLCERIADVRFVFTRIHETVSDLVGDGTGGKGSDVDICYNGGRYGIPFLFFPCRCCDFQPPPPLFSLPLLLPIHYDSSQANQLTRELSKAAPGTSRPRPPRLLREHQPG